VGDVLVHHRAFRETRAVVELEKRHIPLWVHGIVVVAGPGDLIGGRSTRTSSNGIRISGRRTAGVRCQTSASGRPRDRGVADVDGQNPTGEPHPRSNSIRSPADEGLQPVPDNPSCEGRTWL
jgi:hypothetical protein